MSGPEAVDGSGSGPAQTTTPAPSDAPLIASMPRTPRPLMPGPSHDAPELERQSFRRRRMVDAACALPFLGLMLWWLPLLWRAPQNPVTTAQALIYIFSVWVALPVATGLLILAIRRASAPDRPEARQ